MAPHHAGQHTLLTIPLEVRLHIYNIVVDEQRRRPSHYGLSILSVCRQIREECIPTVLRELTFSSLKSFCEWVSRAEPGYLSLVKNLSIRSGKTWFHWQDFSNS